ncbi:hypothetical protein E2C01_042687 [Portunus trituberculatus]|uniref:Uncharacterized protein n=1 Tax=Portunus trituberculatus TaxID=210409 RepID=A0A5B7FN12_PORTR|nr:hypothetical protein [Portunus trituberculatus]
MEEGGVSGKGVNGGTEKEGSAGKETEVKGRQHEAIRVKTKDEGREERKGTRKERPGERARRNGLE